MNNISPATHTLIRGSGKLAKCKTCKGKQTTGMVKETKTGKTEPLCSDCAVKKGFQ